MASFEPVELAFNSVEPDGCSKDKAPIIFLHGLTASKEIWSAIPEITAKATNRKVYVVDARNHGDSPWSDEINLDCNVDDLLHFMDTIGAPKAILVGHSMGGITSLKTALRVPERVEKLVLEDIGCRKLPQTVLNLIYLYLTMGRTSIGQVHPDVDEETASKYIFNVARQNLPQELKELVKPEDVNSRIPLKRNSKGRWMFKCNIDVLLESLKQAEKFASELSGVFRGPTCCIYGKNSPFLVGMDEPNIRKYFPNVKMVGIDATHTIHIDCPREFTDALFNFLLE